ncbi:hypothetical protein LQ318_08330 [Aliifodinibius salicampi]|uniref:Integrase core domain-containing protein n=1 Tax=Fodinibius salicampi TaxID=1920655 RepID=A0ABT3PYH1_9BACT|nr:hypothetical protein [Fodinibius salicampi]MCW9712909.1 hypothetical protein [Fodinibius salicampi]
MTRASTAPGYVYGTDEDIRGFIDLHVKVYDQRSYPLANGNVDRSFRQLLK